VEITAGDLQSVDANPFNSKRFFRKPSDQVGVKICGIKTETDALAAIECGADALGFNLFPGSKRYLRWQKEVAWICRLPVEVSRIGVLVNATLEEARRLLEMDLFDALQLHGEESKGYCESLAVYRKPLLKALRSSSIEFAERVRGYPVFGFLIDSCHEGAFGGTGVRFDWTMLRKARIEKPVIAAGGLTPENVAEAIRTMRPYAVDVASGVENSRGSKDKAKMQDFVAAVREFER
jgi:phosphoribosylanthranilate isomerase